MTTYPGPSTPSAPPARRKLLPWLVGLVVLLVLLIVGGLVLALSGNKPESVQDVADQAVEAAEDLDVDDAVELLCEAPSKKDRAELEDAISRAQELTGTEDPDVTYNVSEVKGRDEGSFIVEFTSDEKGLKGQGGKAKVLVESMDGHSCIAGFAEVD